MKLSLPARRQGLCLMGVAMLSLVGCATLRPGAKKSGSFWTGRLALQVKSTPPQNLSASFELQGSAEEGQMALLSPLGTTLARLSWNPQSAWLEHGAYKTESSNLQTLSQKLTGTALPIHAIFEWLQGQETSAQGWDVDLSALKEGRLSARRTAPAPEALLRILLDR
jgi:outer membrane lipoprotein LolB